MTRSTSLFLAALQLSALSAIVACNGTTGSELAPPESAAVQVATVRLEDVLIDLRAFGVVEAKSTVPILSQVTGLITEVRFREGDFVKKGDVLFVIDTRAYSAALAAAQATVVQTVALAQQARVEQDRYRALLQEQVTSKQELLQAESTAASSAAAVKLAQAQVASASLNVSFTRITAPMDGKAGSLLFYPGSLVQAGAATPLVLLRSMSPIQVRFSVPEKHLPEIRARMSEGELAVHVTPRGSEGPATTGRLTFLENAVDSSTGTLSLKAEFDNSGLVLWPGAAVDVNLELNVEKSRIVAPDSAVQTGQQGSYAFVVDATHHARLRQVEVDFVTGQNAVVRAGLAPGDRVVTDGQVRLRDGLAVQLQAPAAQANEQQKGTRIR